MSMLAFFPWLKLNIDKEAKEVDLKAIRLVRFLRGTMGTLCDRILEPYVLSKDEPINEAILFLLRDKEIFADLDEDERNFLFSAAEIIAFSGLSKREYFLPGDISYCNRDDFIFIIQQSREDSDGATIITRRRDGYTKTYVTGESYKVEIPLHIKNFPVKLDIPLIEALLNAQEKLSDKWLLYSEAIFHFNHANTDNDQVPEHQEVVMMVSAFERILGCNRGKEDDLVDKFLEIFKPKENLDMAKCTRIKDSKSKNCNETLREIWIRDFYRLRNDYAHGKKLSKKPLIWKSYEHLLLGSYVFPLVLKCLLKEDGFYELSEDDTLDINGFEELADADLFTNTNEWNRIRSDLYFKEQLRKALADSK